ncbi:SAYSvFN domain-containing protein 1 [Bacillus rossius redtenbacheri]|uniref:SAYSvFN domain-containing protein 1 n=1 Tax=Bacillus rossius redtenbacheri TaxID=93214 RepID=UPI002FDECEE5
MKAGSRPSGGKLIKRKGNMSTSQSLLKKVLVNEHVRATNSPSFRKGQEHSPESSVVGDDLEASDELKCPVVPFLTLASWLLYALLWLTLLLIAAHFEFGAVFVVVSLLCVIWANTRTGPRKQGEMSAYSVFNPDCQPIDGTLRAEQFEREMGYRMLPN